jgi:asparagine synthase (glutamine-hydrolysing)
MCGIFGIIGHKARVPADVLERATASLAHRGPDDTGTVILRDSAQEPIEIGLGNRRLAILDLSPQGHQPMNDPATGNWIVYNGELYNFREVRAKIERQGVYFGSLSDTEVILKAYAHWGEKCLDEFRGMFAFAIWDAQRHKLFLARDPMGIKPLYYFCSDQYFLFSSEVRTLLGTGLVPRRIDPAGLLNFLTFGSLCDPNTLVEGVAALPPGRYLNWQQGRVKQVQYWDLIDTEVAEACRRASAGGAVRRDELEAQVSETLDESVRMQLVSDVPVGVFLSGGIDSSSLVGILSRSGIRPSTFSIVFREAEYSEAEYSRLIANRFRTDHHEITVSQADFFAVIDPSIHAMDLPTIDGINTYFVSQQTRAAGVKVAISGLGGDEMFAGYSSFRTVPRMERFANVLEHIPGSVRSSLANGFAAFAPSNDQNRKLTALARNGGAIVHPYFLSRMLFTPPQLSELLPAISANPIVSERASKSAIENLTLAERLDPVNRVSFLEARCYMLNTLLRDSDFMSMAHGLEVRVPLIDHKLARQLMALPGSWKLNAGTPKPLLVHALRGELPDQIVHRPKRGFTLPFEYWLRDALRPEIEKSLGKFDQGPLRGIISVPAVSRVWADFLSGKTSWSRPWALFVLQRWCEQHSLSC